jgi:hypothetical protein
MSLSSNPLFLGYIGRFFSWKIIVIVYIPLLAILWFSVGEQSKKMESQGIMNVSVDPESKLPLIDLSVDNPLKVQSFHAAVLEKEFTIKGVQTTVALTQLNPTKTLQNKEDYEILFYSDILNVQCLTKLQEVIGRAPNEGVKIDDLVQSACGKPVFPLTSSKPISQVANLDDIQNFCKEEPCGPCLVVQGQQSINGQCEVQKTSFLDKSRYIKTGDTERFDFSYKPLKKLSYMKYAPN